ncbi:MAG: M28 family peptidase [Planctomycetota bacterium]|jgi:hypothetical protein|nr:M28 family peptidase [Planctomycetota bacterium]MDP6941088.1 M28 family peptidase [Planctomycetota bacterium]
MNRTTILLPFLLLYGVGSSLTAQSDRTAIRAEDLREHISYLASDKLKGRESGKEGGHAAANYFAEQWLRLGLEPLSVLPDDRKQAIAKDYLLPFNVRRLECLNTAGLLAGTDPSLADQILVIGGHHDHAGVGGPGAMGSPGEIHNGADDNASGSSGVAELAEWFVAHPIRRPILFMTFSAEERGLLGSKAFVEDGPIPTENMYAMINCDMIGRSVNDYLYVGGLGTSEEFHPLLDDILKESGMDVEMGDAGEAPSDNTSFYHGGVPSLFFFTHIHEDYHMPGDDADKIQYDAEVKILELVRDCALALDARDASLNFVSAPGMAMPADFNQKMMEHFMAISERKRNRGKLGVSVEVEAEAAGLRISKVRSSSAAQAGGLQVDDTLLSIANTVLKSKDDLRRALGGKVKGDVIQVSYLRQGKEHATEVTLK